FGGNSNWRGPVWFPLNYLIIESLQKFDWYYGSTFTVEHPVGSGRMLTLWEVSVELSRRLIRIFVDHEGRRAVFGNVERFQKDPLWRDLIPFHEYFHGDDGAGLGAAHQTGWTALVAKLIQQSGVPAVR
ncbi:MAG: MGH1-like glycoside hydrolase domain-containing protein, partial [bacterium]